MLFGGKYRIGNNDGASRWTNTRYFPTLAEAQDRTSNDAVVSFVAPLAAAPLLTRSDVAMLDQLTAAGVLARDVVEFGPGLTLGDLAMALSADGGTLSVRWGAAGFNLGIPTASFGFGGASLPASILEIEEDFFSAFDSFEYDLGLASALSAYRLGAGVEAFRFADGSSFTLEQILRLAGSQVSIVGTAGNDILSGGAAGERIAGLGGNDTLSGNGGNDTVSGGPGNDTLSGGAGSDGLYGSAGNDAYLFNRGDGADIVYDYDELAGNSDTIRFGASVAPADIAFSRTGNNLVLRNVASGDTVTAQAHYTAAGRIERFEFANGTGVTLRDASSIIFGTGQSDEIGGTENGESIFGYAGDDWISAGAGDDAIFGGGGDDFLAGDAGDDTYVYEAGGGVDGIYDSGGTDSVRFGAGIAPEDVTVFADPWGSLYLSVENPGNRLELYNWFDGGFKVEQAVFADGTVWNAAQLESRITQPSATEFSDLLFLTGGDDVVDALGGDDEVHGLGGNDILSGGAGADRVSGDEGHNLVTGGTGNDRVESGEVEEARNLFIGGAGDDRILAYGTANVVAFNPGDGEDFLQAGYGAPLTLSIGSASAADIVLSWVTEGEGETSLRIGVSGAGGVRTFAYNEGTQNGPAATLQLIGADIRTYDLNAVVQAFFAASELEEISVWSAGQALADNLLTVSTTEAIGGDIAYRYARTGGIDGLATEEQQAVLASDAFALAPQPITFIASNRAPTLDHPVADQAANEDAAFGFTLPADAFSDPDAGDLLSYTATLADGSPLPGWLSFDAQAGTFSGTPLQSNTGLLNLKVTATDAAGLFADDSFALAIANSNDAPADIALSANLVAENAPDALVGTLSTADEDAGDTFTYSIVPGGDGAQFAISGDALRVGAAGLDFEAGATRGVTVRSTDAAGAFFDQAITVNVGDVNEAPLLANAIADRNAAEDAAFSFTVPVETFADPDAADVLTWFAARPDGGALPAWLAFDGATRSFSGTPAQADVGTLELRVTASDGGGLSASGAFALTVANVNDTPAVANDILDQSFEAGAQLVFSLASNVFIDEDGESPALSASLYGGGVLPAWLSFNASTGTFTGNPLASNIGISHLAVTATDAAGASAVSDFGLIVRAAAGSSVTGGAGDDVIYGGTGDETLVARGGRDYLNGDTGNDLLRGGGGDDVLQGGADADALRGGVGQNLLDGGTGDDLIYGGQGSAFITGGAGNDTLRVGQGNDVIAFNAGDGIDTVYGGRDGGNTLSFGGSIGYEDLSLSRSGRDLVVSAGENDRIVLKNWYNGNHSVLSLQLILDATEAFDAGSADPLFNKRVQRFDFAGLVSAFDQARAASPGLTSWAVTNALLQFHLSGADDAALGGDLAYWYGRNNSLTGISLAAAQQVIGAPGFGSDAQTLRPFSGLQDGFVKLS